MRGVTGSYRQDRIRSIKQTGIYTPSEPLAILETRGVNRGFVNIIMAKADIHRIGREERVIAFCEYSALVSS